MDTRPRWQLPVIRLVSLRIQKRLLLLSVLLLFVGLVDQLYQPFLGPQWYWLWIVLLANLLIWSYFAFLLPRSTVSVEANHLSLQTPLRKLTIPFDHIVNFKASTLEQHFAYEQLSTTELAWIQPVFQKPCLQVEMRPAKPTMQGNRGWVSRFLFTPDGRDLLLVVDDWLLLSKTVNTTYLKWQQQKTLIRKPEGSPNAAQSAQTTSPLANSEMIREEKRSQENDIATGEKITAQTRVGRASQSIGTTSNGHLAGIEISADEEAPLLLIVDDNQHMLSQLEMLFEPHYRVITARDGKMGMHHTLHFNPDLIISDIMMPESNGFELLEFVRSSPGSELTPFIMLTGDHNPDNLLRAFKAGVSDYITKPCDGKELLARAHRLLQQQSRVIQLLELNHRLEKRLEAQMRELIVSGNLQQFLPQTVARSVRAGQITNYDEFERRHVTVLFADIVGFTPLAERLPPGILANILNEYLQEMAAVATMYEGSVDKFIGDGLLVLFGAPTRAPEVEQAWSALQTASAMHYQMKRFSESWSANISQPFQMRIGIHTGPCVLGVFGSDVLRSYTAIGVGVNTAFRLQAQAKAGTTLISRQTYELVSDRAEAAFVSSLKLKGVLDAVEAFEVTQLSQ